MSYASLEVSGNSMSHRIMSCNGRQILHVSITLRRFTNAVLIRCCRTPPDCSLHNVVIQAVKATAWASEIGDKLQEGRYRMTGKRGC